MKFLKHIFGINKRVAAVDEGAAQTERVGNNEGLTVRHRSLHKMKDTHSSRLDLASTLIDRSPQSLVLSKAGCSSFSLIDHANLSWSFCKACMTTSTTSLCDALVKSICATQLKTRASCMNSIGWLEMVMLDV